MSRCRAGTLATPLLRQIAAGLSVVPRIAMDRGPIRCKDSCVWPASLCPGEESGMVNQQGLVQIQCRYSVDETLQRLELAFATHGLQGFARVDHSGEAEKAGMKMRPTKLLIFGSPKAGTPLMVAAPTLAIDLPLKALVWEDETGKVWLTYNSPEYLRDRHGVPSELIKNIVGAGALMEKAVE